MATFFRTRSLLLAALLALGLASANAGVVTAQAGVDDGFGIGVASGDAFFSGDLDVGNDLSQWHIGGSSVSISASWVGALTSAHLDVFSGGWGLGGQAGVYLNNTLVGLLTDGDIDSLGDNYATLDSFDLSSALGLVAGSNLIEIRTQSGDDAGVLGFVRLSLQVQDAGGGNTVPEPASAALAAVALASALLVRRRRD